MHSPEYDPTPEEQAEHVKPMTLEQVSRKTRVALYAYWVMRLSGPARRARAVLDSEGAAAADRERAQKDLDAATQAWNKFKAAIAAIPPEDEPTYPCPTCRGLAYVPGNSIMRLNRVYETAVPCLDCSPGLTALAGWDNVRRPKPKSGSSRVGDWRDAADVK